MAVEPLLVHPSLQQEPVAQSYSIYVGDVKDSDLYGGEKSERANSRSFGPDVHDHGAIVVEALPDEVVLVLVEPNCLASRPSLWSMGLASIVDAARSRARLAALPNIMNDSIGVRKKNNEKLSASQYCLRWICAYIGVPEIAHRSATLRDSQNISSRLGNVKGTVSHPCRRSVGSADARGPSSICHLVCT